VPSSVTVLWTITAVLMAIFISYGVQWSQSTDTVATSSFCSMSDVSYGECVLGSRIEALGRATLLHDTVAFGAGSVVAFWSAIICTILWAVRR